MNVRTRLVIPKIVFAVVCCFTLGVLGGILICLRVGEALILVVAGVLLALVFLVQSGFIDAGLHMTKG